MSIKSFHPGNNADARKGQEMCIIGIIDSYQQIAITPLNDRYTLQVLRDKIRKQKLNLRSWLQRDILE